MQKRFYGGLFVVFLGAVTLGLAAIANGPDRELTLKREVPSHSEAAFLGKLLSDTQSWGLWFHHLSGVQIMKGAGLAEGSVLKLSINSHKSPWSRFDLIATVREYLPGHRIRLRIDEDSSGRLTQLFDKLEWMVEINPDGRGARIKGESAAHTSNWRSRLFGTIATHIVMHQVFYPNLIKLAELTPQTASHPDPWAGESNLLLGPSRDRPQ